MQTRAKTTHWALKKLGLALVLFGFLGLSKAEANPFTNSLVIQYYTGQISRDNFYYGVILEVLTGRATLDEVTSMLPPQLVNAVRMTLSLQAAQMIPRQLSPEEYTGLTYYPIAPTPLSSFGVLGESTCGIPAGVPWYKFVNHPVYGLGYELQPPLPPARPLIDLQWMHQDHPAYPIPSVAFRQLGQMFLLHIPAHLEADPHGGLTTAPARDLIFSDISNYPKDFFAAQAFCEQRGARLPTPKEYLALSQFLGARDPENGIFEGYDPLLIPFTAGRRLMTSEVAGIVTDGGRNYLRPWVFDGNTGRIMEDPTLKKYMVRCVIEVPSTR